MVDNKIEEFYRIRVGNLATDKDIDNVIEGFPDFQKIEGLDVVIKELLRTFMIVKGSYVFDPAYGANLHRYIFEQADAQTFKDISSEVSGVINSIKTNANIDHDVLFFKNKRGFRINLIITENDIKRNVLVDIDESILKTFDR